MELVVCGLVLVGLVVCVRALRSRLGSVMSPSGPMRWGVTLLATALLVGAGRALVADARAPVAWQFANASVPLYVGAVLLALAGVGYRHWVRRAQGGAPEDRTRLHERRRLPPPRSLLDAPAAPPQEDEADAFLFRPRRAARDAHRE